MISEGGALAQLRSRFHLGDKGKNKGNGPWHHNLRQNQFDNNYVFFFRFVNFLIKKIEKYF